METREDWLQFLKDHLDEMCRLVVKYHPKCAREDPRDDDLAAVVIANVVRSKIKSQGGPLFDPPSALRDASAAGDGQQAWRILNDTWWGCPEDSIIQYERGFQDLCTLCSEGYLAVDD